MTEFRKKLQKQEGWYAEGENFDVLAARTKEGGKYQYTLSVSLSKKHKLYRKARKQTVEFIRELFYEVAVLGGYDSCENKRDGSLIVMRYHFPKNFDSLDKVIKGMDSVFNYLSNIK